MLSFSRRVCDARVSLGGHLDGLLGGKGRAVESRA